MVDNVASEISGSQIFHGIERFAALADGGKQNLIVLIVGFLQIDSDAVRERPFLGTYGLDCLHICDFAGLQCLLFEDFLILIGIHIRLYIS